MRYGISRRIGPHQPGIHERAPEFECVGKRHALHGTKPQARV